MHIRVVLYAAVAVVAWPAASRGADVNGYKPPVTVTIVNRSGLVSAGDATVWAGAIQRQVREHLAPSWKVDAEVRFRETAEPGDWVCAIEDTGATARLLGAHFVQDGGVPGCAVYAKAILAGNAGGISRQLSHEICEMLVNPWLSNVTFASPAGPERVMVYLREVCDPVSAYSYDLDGVTVSNFTLPDFWARGGALGKQLDYLGVAAIALEPAAHSYMLVRYISLFGGIDSIESWSYIWGSYCLFGPC